MAASMSVFSKIAAEYGIDQNDPGAVDRFYENEYPALPLEVRQSIFSRILFAASRHDDEANEEESDRRMLAFLQEYLHDEEGPLPKNGSHQPLVGGMSGGAEWIVKIHGKPPDPVRLNIIVVGEDKLAPVVTEYFEAVVGRMPVTGIKRFLSVFRSRYTYRLIFRVSRPADSEIEILPGLGEENVTITKMPGEYA